MKVSQKEKFLIEGFSTPYRLDRDSKRGGIVLYVRADIPSNLLAFEDKPIELNLQNTKTPMNCSYSPYESEIKKNLAALKNSLDSYSSKYEKVLILGDFNVEIEEANINSLCENYNLKLLTKQPTCYKNPNKSTCIDLIINFPRMFQSTCVSETGLSDFHLMTVTVMRKTFTKMHPRVINYRSYRDFSNETFGASLINNLSNELFVNNDDGLEKFCKTTMYALNSFAPIKKKYACGNQMSFMPKNLSKELMTRSRLRNKYLKHKTEENRLLYTQQRNKCVCLLRKTKINYYENLDEKDITDNKIFWETVKPLLSDKSINSDKIHLNENIELINCDSKTA